MHRWRVAAAQIQPPMTEEEMGNEFWKTLKTKYQKPLAVCIGYTFSQMIKLMERMETEAKLERTNKETREKDSGNLEMEDNTVNALSTPTTNRYRPPNNEFIHIAPYHNMTPPTNFQNSPHPQTHLSGLARQTRRFHRLPISYTDLYQQLLENGMIKLAPMAKHPANQARNRETKLDFTNPSSCILFPFLRICGIDVAG